MICKNCGSYVKDDSKFCTICGAPIVKTPPPIQNVTQHNRQDNFSLKNNSNLIIISVSFIIFAIILIIVFIFLNNSSNNNIETANSHQGSGASLNNNYNAPPAPSQIEEQSSHYEETSSFIYEESTSSLYKPEETTAYIPPAPPKAQTTPAISIEDKVSVIRKLYQETNDNNNYTVENFSFDWGHETGKKYIDKKTGEIKKLEILAHDHSEEGIYEGTTEVYLKDKKVYFVFRYYKYTDPHSGNVTSRGEQRYYFDSGSLIRYIGEDGKIQNSLNTKEYKETETDIINDIEYYLKFAF